MTTTTTPTSGPAALLAARAAAQRLTVQQKAQLLSELANEIAQIAGESAVTESTAVGEGTTHRTLWAQLQNSMRELPVGRRTLAAQLEQDRAERDQSLGSS